MQVFNDTLPPIITDVMKGFESTVFAYGQTGTGKTAGRACFHFEHVLSR